MITLYMLISPVGKKYIGVTSCPISRRLVLHKSHAKREIRGALQRAIRKYGFENFAYQILIVCDDWGFATTMERAAIVAFNTMAPAGYNLTEGGEGHPRNKWSAKIRDKISVDRRTIGHRHSEETKKKISDAQMGRAFSPETRAKIGATKVGNLYNLGRPCSSETRRKIAEAQRGVPKFSDEQKENFSNLRRGKPWSPARREAQERRRVENNV